MLFENIKKSLTFLYVLFTFVCVILLFLWFITSRSISQTIQIPSGVTCSAGICSGTDIIILDRRCLPDITINRTIDNINQFAYHSFNSLTIRSAGVLELCDVSGSLYINVAGFTQINPNGKIDISGKSYLESSSNRPRWLGVLDNIRVDKQYNAGFFCSEPNSNGCLFLGALGGDLGVGQVGSVISNEIDFAIASLASIGDRNNLAVNGFEFSGDGASGPRGGNGGLLFSNGEDGQDRTSRRAGSGGSSSTGAVALGSNGFSSGQGGKGGGSFFLQTDVFIHQGSIIARGLSGENGDTLMHNIFTGFPQQGDNVSFVTNTDCGTTIISGHANGCTSSAAWVSRVDACIYDTERLQGGTSFLSVSESAGIGNKRCKIGHAIVNSDACSGRCVDAYSGGTGGHGSGGSGGGGGGGGIVIVQANSFQQVSGSLDLIGGNGGFGNSLTNFVFFSPVSSVSTGSNRITNAFAVNGLRGLNGSPGRTTVEDQLGFICNVESTFGNYAYCNANQDSGNLVYGGASGGSSGGGGGGGAGQHGIFLLIPKEITENVVSFQDRTQRTPIDADDLLYDGAVTLATPDSSGDLIIASNTVQCLTSINDSPFINGTSRVDESNVHVFNNLTIEPNAVLTVCDSIHSTSAGYGNLQIKLRGDFINQGIIDLRAKGPIGDPPDWVIQNVHILYTGANNLVNEVILPISGGNGGAGSSISVSSLQVVSTTTSEGGRVSSNLFESSASRVDGSNSGGGGGAGGLAMQKGGDGANGGSSYQQGVSGFLFNTEIGTPFLISGRGGIGGRPGGLLFLDIDGAFDNRHQILLDGSDGQGGRISGYYRVRTAFSFISNITENANNLYFCEGFDGGSGGGGGGGGGGLAYIQAGEIFNFGNIRSFGGFGARGGDTLLYSGGSDDYVEGTSRASFGTGRTTSESINSFATSCGLGGSGGAGGKGADGVIYVGLKSLDNLENIYHQGQQIPNYSSLTQILDIGPTVDLIVNGEECLSPFQNSDVPLDRLSSFDSSDFSYSSNYHTFQSVQITSTGVLTVCEQNNFGVISLVGTGNLHLKVDDAFLIEEGGLIDLRAKGDITTPLQYSFFSGSSLVGDQNGREEFIRGTSLSDNSLCTLRFNNQVNQLGYSIGVSSQGLTNDGGSFLQQGQPNSNLGSAIDQLYLLFNQRCKSRFSVLAPSSYSSEIISLIGDFGQLGGLPGGTFYLEANSFENRGDVLLQGADGRDGKDAPYLFFSSSLQPKFQIRGVAGFGSGGGGGGLAIIKAQTILNFGSIRTEGGNGGRGGATSVPGELGASQTYSSHLLAPFDFGAGVGGGRGENGPILFVHSDRSLARTLNATQDINEPYLTIGSCYECLLNSDYCNLILFLRGCIQESYIPSLNLQEIEDVYYQNIYFGAGLSPDVLTDENWINMNLIQDLLNGETNRYWLQVDRLFISEENTLGTLGASFGLEDFSLEQASYSFDDISFERYLCLKGNQEECTSARLTTDLCSPLSVLSFLIDGCTYSSINYLEQEELRTSLGYNIEGRQFNHLYGVDSLPVFQLSNGINRLYINAVDSLGRQYRSQPKSILIDQYAPCDNISNHECSIIFQDSSGNNQNIIIRNGISTVFLNDLDFTLQVNVDERNSGSGLSLSANNFMFFFLRQERANLLYFSSGSSSVANVNSLFNQLNQIQDKTCFDLFEPDGAWSSMRDGVFVMTVPSDGELLIPAQTSIPLLSGTSTTLFDYFSNLFATDSTFWFIGCVRDQAGNWSRMISKENSVFLNQNNLNLYEGAERPLDLMEYDSLSIDLQKETDVIADIYFPSFYQKSFLDLSTNFDEPTCSTEPCPLLPLQGVVRGTAGSTNQVDTIAFHPSSYVNFLTISGDANLIVGIKLPFDLSGIRRVWYRLGTLGSLNGVNIVNQNSGLSTNELSLSRFNPLEVQGYTGIDSLCRDVRQSNSNANFRTDVNFCFSVSVTNQDSAICILLEDYAGHVHNICSTIEPQRNLQVLLTDYESPRVISEVHLEGISENDVQSTSVSNPEILFEPSVDVGSSGMDRYVICYFLTQVQDTVYSTVSSTDLLNLYSSLQTTSSPCPSDSFVYEENNNQGYSVSSQEILYSIGTNLVRSFRTSESLTYGLWMFVILAKDRAGNYSQPYLYLLNIDDDSSFLLFDEEYATTTSKRDFLNGAVSPQLGTTGEYSFRVRYFDFSGRCPTKSEISLDLDGNGLIEDNERLQLLPATCNGSEVIVGKSYYINNLSISYLTSSKSCEPFYQITKGCIFYRFLFENQGRTIIGEAIQNQFLFLFPYSQDFAGEVRIHNNIYLPRSQEFPTVVLKPPVDENFPIRVLIMSQRGETVRVLVDRKMYSSALPNGYIRWNTRNETNSLVLSGVYYLVYHNARGSHFRKKIVVVR